MQYAVALAVAVRSDRAARLHWHCLVLHVQLGTTARAPCHVHRSGSGGLGGLRWGHGGLGWGATGTAGCGSMSGTGGCGCSCGWCRLQGAGRGPGTRGGHQRVHVKVLHDMVHSSAQPVPAAHKDH
jgi:hypothetical protein